MGPEIFHVVSEFRFDVTHAILSADKLETAVEGISKAADNTLLSFQRMTGGIVAQMGLGTGGVLGALYEAIKASEKFADSQRKIANIFVSNPLSIEGGAVTFLEAMEASSAVLDDIQKKARAFSLPVGPFTDMVNLIGAPLFSMGLAGTNMSNAIELARTALKTAPTLGISPEQIPSQLTQLLSGHANIQDQFIQRLVQDTTAFKKLGIGEPSGGGNKQGGFLGAFNALAPAERLKVLTEALGQFSNSTEVVEANARSLTQQMQVLRDNLTGIGSILKPIGKALTDFLAPVVAEFNKTLQTHGVAIGKQLGATLKTVIGSPEQLLENLFQIKSLKRDLDSTNRVLSVVGVVQIIGSALKFFGMTARLASPWISAFAGALTVFIDVWNRMPTVGTYLVLAAAGFAALIAAIAVFPPIAGMLATAAAIFAFFQLLSRAQAIAAISDAKEMPRLLERLSRLTNAFMTTFGRLISPFTQLYEALAQLISPLFQITGWIDVLSEAFYGVIYDVSLLEAGFLGLQATITSFLSYLTSSQMIENPSGILSASADAFSREFDRVMNENLKSLTDPESGAVMNQVVNINGGVSINNAFNSQMEPDRIAFTLKDQLLKAARNPSQAQGKVFNGAS